MKIKVSLKLGALIAGLQDWKDYSECPAFSECPFNQFNSALSKCPFLFFSILFFVSHGCFYSYNNLG